MSKYTEQAPLAVTLLNLKLSRKYLVTSGIRTLVASKQMLVMAKGLQGLQALSKLSWRWRTKLSHPKSISQHLTPGSRLKKHVSLYLWKQQPGQRIALSVSVSIHLASRAPMLTQSLNQQTHTSNVMSQQDFSRVRDSETTAVGIFCFKCRFTQKENSRSAILQHIPSKTITAFGTYSQHGKGASIPQSLHYHQ